MSLRIDVPNKFYTASSPVTGNVTLIGTEDVGVGSISITFSGRCKSKIVVSRGNNGSSTYRGRVTLFTYTQTLFRGPHTLHPSEHSWAFSFRFPERCEEVVRSGDWFQSDPRYCDDVNQPLPSTYHLLERGWQRRQSGFVSYQLEATLSTDGTRIFSSWQNSTTKELKFVKVRVEAAPDPRMIVMRRAFVCQSMHLMPGYEQRSLTFKEKLASLRSKNVPTATFELVLEMPQVVVCNQALPLYLSVEHGLTNPTLSTTPSVSLKGIKVSLQANGSVRCMNEGLSTILGDYDREESWDEDITIATLDLTGRPTPINERIDLRNVMDLKAQSRPGLYGYTVQPTFSTFNLRLQYSLRVKITVECAQKTFRRELVSQPLEVLAGEWVGHLAENASAALDVQHAPAYGLSELLPPYAKDPELLTPSPGKAPSTSLT